jgi:hypothetical protein
MNKKITMEKLYIEIPWILDIKRLISAKGFKTVDLSINDNKRMINKFEGKFTQFLMRNKGSVINNKEDLITILNKKPRSFLDRLTNLVNNFKNFDSKLHKNLRTNKIHHRNLIKSNKDINNLANQPWGTGDFLNTPTKKNNNFPLNCKANYPIFTKGKDGKEEINMYQEIFNKSYTLITCTKQIDKSLYLISKRIEHLLVTLRNNKLAIPINLLKPLLNKHTNYKANILQNTIESNNLNNNNLINNKNSKFVEFDLSSFFKDLSKVTFPYNKELSLESFKQRMAPSSLLQINKFKDKIKLFNNNDLSNMTFTKYFELITAYKFVKPFHQYIRYNFNIQNNKQIKNITILLEYAFKAMSCLISKPVFCETPNKVIINLFYCFIPGKSYKVIKTLNNNKFNSNSNRNSKSNNISNNNRNINLNKNKKSSIPKLTSFNGIDIENNLLLNPIKNVITGKMRFKNLNKQFLNSKNINKLNKLCTILSRIWNKEVSLDLIPLSVPLFDDNILVKAIGIMSKTINLKQIFTAIYRNSILYSKVQADLRYNYSTTQSFLSGIKVRIGGRLMGRSIVPRESRLEFQRGATAVGKVTFVDWSRVNLKNRRGAHSITVTMSHVI